MKKFTLLIALFVCAIGFSQTKSLSESEATTTFSSADPNAKKVERKAVDLSSKTVNQRLAEFTLTHNTDNIITDANSVACNGGDNSQARVFVLADFGVTDEFTISSGEIGVQTIGADMNATVNVWDIDGGFPVGFPGTGVLLGTQAVTIPVGSDLTIVNYTFDTPVVVPAGTGSILVEVIQSADGVSWFIGGTAAETDDSWLASTTCGLAEYGITADIGFPDAHYYITVTGDTDGGGSGGDCDVTEDFEAGLPAGWSTVINTGSCDWANSMAMAGGTDFPTLAMTFDDDACGSGGDPSNVTLMSDIYDTNGATAATLGYDYGFVEIAAGETFTVEVFDGAAWQQVALYDVTVDPFATESIDVVAHANADFQVRWTYDDAAAWAWSAGVDNFCLSYDLPEPPSCDESADFEAGLPAGWSTVVNTGDCDWANSMAMAGGTDFPTLAMTFDDDACGSGAPASNVTLMSDVYNTNGATTATLGYDYGFVEIAAGETFTVEVFDGAAWQEVAFYDVTVDPFATESIDVVAHANADFQVRWTYDDAAAWAWSAGVDNFCLSHDGGGSTGVENDLCDDAIAVECGNTASGDSTDATNTDAPADCDGLALDTAPGVWYSLTIPGDGDYNVSIDTEGSDYDTKLGLFSGDCGALVCEASDDDGGTGLLSLIDFVGTSGETYTIYLTGFSSGAGLYNLNVACEIIGGNDDCGLTGPGNNFENGASCTFNLGRIIAHDMDVAADMDMSLETISANIFIGPEAGGINAAFVDVHIYEDNAGTPGAEIALEAGLVPTSQTEVGAGFGYQIWEVVLDITPVDLEGQAGVATTYWIGLSVESTDASNLFWENSTAGVIGNGQAYDDGTGAGFVMDGTLEGVYTFSGTCEPLGVSNNTIEGFSYYPNPSTDVINLNAQDNIERVAIYNILGQKVVDQNINATSSQIDVSNLVTGAYLMEVSVNGRSATYKILKN